MPKGSLTEIEFPVLRFPRQQARKAPHLVAANLVMVDVLVITVAKRPQVVRLVSPLDLAESMRGR